MSLNAAIPPSYSPVSNVISFSNAARRTAEAEKLVEEWRHLQQYQDHGDTLAALPGWRDKMQAWGRKHGHRPNPSDITGSAKQGRKASELVREWLSIQTLHDGETDPVGKTVALMTWRVAMNGPAN